MGIKDAAKKAADKATPVIKEKAVDAGRMAKAMGETVIEEKPLSKAAHATGKAIKSAGNAIAENEREKRQEKTADVYANLKAKYPGCVLLFEKKYNLFNDKKFRALGVDLNIIDQNRTVMIFLDENKTPKYRVHGDFNKKIRLFKLVDWNGKTLGSVKEHNRLIRNRSESIYLGGRHVTDLYVGSSCYFNDSRFGLVDTPILALNRDYLIHCEGHTLIERTTVNGFNIMSIPNPENEVLGALFHTAVRMCWHPPEDLITTNG